MRTSRKDILGVWIGEHENSKFWLNVLNDLKSSGDYFLGCSVAAGQFVFGSRIHQKPNFAVACNAVDQTRFYANAAARSALRAEYGILPSQKLAGFVGRYNHQKRIPMILEIFSLRFCSFS